MSTATLENMFGIVLSIETPGREFRRITATFMKHALGIP